MECYEKVEASYKEICEECKVSHNESFSDKIKTEYVHLG
jgi:hypothetical protein